MNETTGSAVVLRAPDFSQLPYLLQLLDDDSEIVRGAVSRELLQFGPELGEALAALPVPIDRLRSARLATILAEGARDELRLLWPCWFEVPDEYERLELALTLLSEFQDQVESVLRGKSPEPVSLLLDRLADGYRSTVEAGDARGLAEYLFGGARRLRGAAKDYFAPQNSNLRYVIEKGRGIPISLAAVYMLTARRCGLKAGGCNWPGHFLARAEIGGRPYLIDCYNDGNCMELDAFLSMQGPSKAAARRVLEEDASVETIIGRVLNNLVRAYQESGHWANSHLMLELLREVERRIAGIRSA